MTPRLTLREAREKRAYTQADLEGRSGVRQGHISELETGTAIARPNTMKRLASALQMEAWLSENGALLFEEHKA